jgi:hypothetical protein
MVDALKRPGWLTFAAVIMFTFGGIRIVTAIYYFANSVRVNNLTHGAFGGHLFLWGLWDLLIAALAFWAGWSLLGGHPFGRVFAYFWAGVVLFQSFLIIGQAPWFAFGSMILGALVIYAVSSTESYETRSG